MADDGVGVALCPTLPLRSILYCLYCKSFATNNPYSVSDPAWIWSGVSVRCCECECDSEGQDQCEDKCGGDQDQWKEGSSSGMPAGWTVHRNMGICQDVAWHRLYEYHTYLCTTEYGNSICQCVFWRPMLCS